MEKYNEIKYTKIKFTWAIETWKVTHPPPDLQILNAGKVLNAVHAIVQYTLSW